MNSFQFSVFSFQKVRKHQSPWITAVCYLGIENCLKNAHCELKTAYAKCLGLGAWGLEYAAVERGERWLA